MRTLILITFLLGAMPIATAQNLVSVETVTDQYGSETIWQITGWVQGVTHIGSGFVDFDEPGTYVQWTEQFDLPDGSYQFGLISGEDGLCCNWGYGWVTVRHVASGQVLFRSDSSFTSGDGVFAYFTLPLGRVQGTVFLDEDHSCDPGVDEPRIPGQVLRVLPGPIYGLTDANGNYDIRVPYGDFTIDVVSTGLVPICPATEPVPFNSSADSPVAQILLGDSSVAKLDIVASAVIGPARPGFTVTHTIQFTNASTFLSGPITATAQLDPLIVYTGASVTPASVVGNTITWSLPALSGYTQHTIQLQGQLPPDPLLIGDELTVSASAYQTLDEQVLWNNACTAHVIITGSVDPNDKQVWPHDRYDLAVDSVLDYTIRFQNTGTDTAFTVVITDTLRSELDMGTFQAGASTHPCTISFKPDRVVEWRFANILLPDSNVNEPASHGQVGFRIRPLQPLLPGTIIENIANIYFDYNPPVITEPSVLVAEFSTGVMQLERSDLVLAPVPAQDELIVTSGSAIGVIRILGADGRVVLQASARSTQVRIDLAGLKAGAYVLLAELENGTTARERFIKQ